MNYKIDFQLMEPGKDRPNDAAQEEHFEFVEDGSFMPIPAVGDSVLLTLTGGSADDYKVITRHFQYLKGACYINIVVTEMDEEEKAARLKA